MTQVEVKFLVVTSYPRTLETSLFPVLRHCFCDEMMKKCCEMFLLKRIDQLLKEHYD